MFEFYKVWRIIFELSMLSSLQINIVHVHEYLNITHIYSKWELIAESTIIQK